MQFPNGPEESESAAIAKYLQLQPLINQVCSIEVYIRFGAAYGDRLCGQQNAVNDQECGEMWRKGTADIIESFGFEPYLSGILAKWLGNSLSN